MLLIVNSYFSQSSLTPLSRQPTLSGPALTLAVRTRATSLRTTSLSVVSCRRSIPLGINVTTSSVTVTGKANAVAPNLRSTFEANVASLKVMPKKALSPAYGIVLGGV